MPDEKRGRGHINWLAIRTDYAEGETNLTALAKKHGTTRVSIWRKMQADKEAGSEWASRKDIRNAIVTDVTGRVAERIAAEQGDNLVGSLQRHGEIDTIRLDIALNVLKAAKTFAKTLADSTVPITLEQVQIAKGVVDLANKAVDGSRLVEGVPRDMPSVGRTQQDDGVLVIEQRRLEPKPLESRNGTQT